MIQGYSQEVLDIAAKRGISPMIVERILRQSRAEEKTRIDLIQSNKDLEDTLNQDVELSKIDK